MDSISLKKKLSKFDVHWSPKLIGELNGQYVKLAKGVGELVWHAHAEEDEFFLVLAGRLHPHFRDRVTILNPGECCIVPRGVEHKPVAEGEVQVLLFEPKSTRYTGDHDGEQTVAVDDQDWI
jgi:mannose-6-phosphate isomerase-like protein (cupin superfamily)|tara:strand:- start:198 stop:563 length:366 start_codon:yes stop_codon:yes gene_type:complete